MLLLTYEVPYITVDSIDHNLDRLTAVDEVTDPTPYVLKLFPIQPRFEN